MGTWGAGNFQDDHALDWLGDQIQTPLTDTVERELLRHDEANGALIMAAIEILALICEHTPLAPPKPQKIEGWRQAYLATWNKYIDELDPKSGFKEARLQVIEATFDRLANIAQKRCR